MATTPKRTARKAPVRKPAAKAAPKSAAPRRRAAKPDAPKVDAKLLANVGTTRKAQIEATAAHDAAVVAARDAGATIKQIADAAGITPQVVRNTLKRAGRASA
jgi:hypothetical protein